MRFASLNGLLLIMLALAGQSAIAADAPALDPLDARWKELCKYDDRCTRIRDEKSGDWATPSADTVSVLRTSKPVILAAAKLYGVDPRAIAGAILTENSLNLKMKHQAELWIASFMRNTDHTIFKKRFGTGIGQLHDDVTIAVEPRAAQIEGRAPLSQIQVRDRMETVEGSIYYIAAILKDAQDVYRANGFEISKDIGLLDTLYNLGGYQMRAAQSKAQGRAPRVNHFGLYVLHNEPLLSSIVGMNTQAPAPASVEEPASSHSHGFSFLKSSEPVPTKKGRSVTSVKEDLSLANLPDLCDRSNHRAQVATLKKDVPFTVIASDVDCNLNKWNLVSGQDGAVGWVRSSVLQAKTVKTDTDSSCSAKIDESCSKKLSKQARSRLKPMDNENSFSLALNPISDCNAKVDDSGDTDLDIDPANELNFSDEIPRDQVLALFKRIQAWQTILAVGRANPYFKLIYPMLMVQSSGHLFMARDQFDQLVQYFSNPPNPNASKKEIGDLSTLMDDAVIVNDQAFSYMTTRLSDCKVPASAPKTRAYLDLLKLNLLSDSDTNSFMTLVIRKTPQEAYDALESLIKVCQTEFSNPAPVPASEPARSPSGACHPSTAASASVTSNISDAQAACAQLLASDDDLLKKVKTAFPLKYSDLKGFSEKSVTIRECGYDLKEASKTLKSLAATGCVKQIYVESLTSFEVLANAGIKSIYRPMKEEGQFKIDPLTQQSCGPGEKP